jgi:hypothetical protein
MRRSHRRPKPITTAMGWGMSRAEMEASAQRVFQGELMKCVFCGAEQRSSPDTNTEWRALTVQGRTW